MFKLPELKFNNKDESIEQEKKSLLDRFSITKENLEEVKGFKNLEKGQQYLVLENFAQLTLERVQEEAQAGYKENLKNAGFWGKLWQGINKKYNLATLEKQKLKDVEGKSFADHKNILEILTSGIREFGPEVEINEDGKLDIKYVTGLNNLSPEQQEKVDAFNKLAIKLSRISHEYQYDSADKRDQREYSDLKAEYDSTKKYILKMKEERSSAKEACEFINDIDFKVQMNQFLNTHPEAEKQLQNIKDKRAWAQALNNVLTERGTYFAFGYVARSLSVGLLGALGAPLAAGGMGGFRAYKRSKEGLKEKDINARKGLGAEERAQIKDKKIELIKDINERRKELEKLAPDTADRKELEESINLLEERLKDLKYGRSVEKKFSDAEKVIKKIKLLTIKLDDAEIAALETNEDGQYDPELLKKVNIYKKALKLNIDWLEDKKEKGLINFGSMNERIFNQYILLSALGQGKTRVEGYKLDDKFRENFESAINERDSGNKKERQKQIWKETRKGIYMGIGFASAGYLIRDFFSGDEVSQAGANQNVVDSTGPKITPSDPEVLAIKGDFIKRNFNTLLEKGMVTKDMYGDFEKRIMESDPDHLHLELKDFLEERGKTISEDLNDVSHDYDGEKDFVSGGSREEVLEEKEAGLHQYIPGSTEIKENGLSKDLEDIGREISSQKPADVSSDLEDIGKEISEQEGKTEVSSESWSMNENIARMQEEKPAGSWSMNENVAQEKINNAIERGLKQNFALKLGEGKVPQSLERVFHMMSVNAMSDVLGEDQIFGEEEGAKSLNVAANLVRLAEGKNTVGIKAEELRDVLSWDQKTGTLEIKDYDKFNDLIKNLHDHADELWEKGILKEGAVKYLDDIEKNTWKEIVGAQGLEEQLEGHDELEAVSDFKTQDGLDDIKDAMEKKSVGIKTKIDHAEAILDKRDHVKHLAAHERYTDEISDIFKGDDTVWNKIKGKMAEDFLSGKFHEGDQVLDKEDLSVYTELQKHLKEAQDLIGVPQKNESISDYLYRFQTEKIDSAVTGSDGSIIKKLSQEIGIRPDVYEFKKAFTTMPESIKLDEIRSQGYMKLFAGSKMQQGQGLKELLGLGYTPHAADWSRGINGTITLKNAFGLKDFDILLKNDKIGVDGPGDFAWGTKGGYLNELEPKRELSIDNIKEAEQIIRSRFNNYDQSQYWNNSGSTQKVDIPAVNAQEHIQENHVPIKGGNKNIPFVDMEKENMPFVDMEGK